jgi:hypothetical protein
VHTAEEIGSRVIETLRANRERQQRAAEPYRVEIRAIMASNPKFKAPHVRARLTPNGLTGAPPLSLRRVQEIMQEICAEALASREIMSNDIEHGHIETD